MSKKIISLGKLLPKTQMPEQEKDEQEKSAEPCAVRSSNIAVALVTAVLLAFVLVPRFPLLQKGETAPANLCCPLYHADRVSRARPDRSFLEDQPRATSSLKRAHRVSDRAARALEEIARREGIGNRRSAYFGLALLILLIFYLFYRDINRYRPAFIRDARKVFLLALLLLATVIVSNFAKFVLSLVTDNVPLDALTIGFALPVSAGAMLVCLLFDFHLALAFSFVVSLLMGILFHGDPFMPVYLFSRKHRFRPQRDTLQEEDGPDQGRLPDRPHQYGCRHRHRPVPGRTAARGASTI